MVPHCFSLQFSLDQANATLCSVDKSGTSVNDASFYCGPFPVLAARDNSRCKPPRKGSWLWLGRTRFGLYFAMELIFNYGSVNKSNNTASDPHLYVNHCAWLIWDRNQFRHLKKTSLKCLTLDKRMHETSTINRYFWEQTPQSFPSVK